MQEINNMDENSLPTPFYSGPDTGQLDVLTVANAPPCDPPQSPSLLSNTLIDGGSLESLLAGPRASTSRSEDNFRQLLDLNSHIHQLVNSLKLRSWGGRVNSWGSQLVLPNQESLTACYPVQGIVRYSQIFLDILRETGLWSHYISPCLGWSLDEHSSSPTFRSAASSRCSNSSPLGTPHLDPPVIFLMLTCFTNIIQLYNIVFRDIIDCLQGDENKRSAFLSALRDLQLSGVNLSRSEVLSIAVLVQTLVHMVKQMHATMVRWQDDVWERSGSSNSPQGNTFSMSGPVRPQDLINPTSDWSSQALWGKVRQAKHMLDAI
ncbi:hypothetical protein BGW36DRAFT_453051 [Talaromyces proteolyticus]|uniref:Uncharacterized protein n=1 Tax=Talaromyces proteolyticus TaxID=1131652 RepID=A0AAD4KMQ5_9EURO|nr:uncharacterized protein BGW36DRAFT_453051 [Talaromyces proteolyticus]KAH8695176.1 hypothetical protein BGW36DRAFT_453051 [Talaromyces proteolyticus]